MEPNKFDSQIREKLDGRTIQPSAQAWDRLDAMLTAAEKPKHNSNWMYVAASFVGFLLIATIFFKQTEELIDPGKHQMVIQNSVIPKAGDVSGAKTTNQIVSNKIGVGGTVEEGRATSKHSKAEAVKENGQINNQNQLAQNTKSEIINQKTISQKSNDASVDEHLALAEPSSKNEILTKKSSIKVNAASLLSQVDGELELSFREKVISKLNKNYQSVKVAVNNRNLE